MEKEASELFDERGADEILEFRPYRATSWQRVGESEPQTPKHLEPAPAAASSGGILQTFTGVLTPIRTFLAQHEELLLIAVVLLLLCDCDDDLELLIAVAALLLPKLGLWSHSGVEPSGK